MASTDKMTEGCLIFCCWPRQVRLPVSCSLHTIHQITSLSLASIFLLHTKSLWFTLPSINILKFSLIQIKSLQHFLQHHYVLLWKLLKCYNRQPKALLHKEYPEPPYFLLSNLMTKCFEANKKSLLEWKVFLF